MVKVPSSIGKLTRLKKISLKHNLITELPIEIGNLTELQSFHLEYNKLEILPDEIGNLKKLEYFYINNNLLNALPKEIGNLTNLKYFIIGKNNLKEIPVEIGNLTYLIELNVCNSGPMVYMPETISNCRALEFLYVDKTIMLPYSIVNTNPRLQIIIGESSVLDN